MTINIENLDKYTTPFKQKSFIECEKLRNDISYYGIEEIEKYPDWW